MSDTTEFGAMGRDIERAEELISEAGYLVSLPNAQFEVAKALHDAEQRGYRSGREKTAIEAASVCRARAERCSAGVMSALDQAAQSILALIAEETP